MKKLFLIRFSVAAFFCLLCVLPALAANIKIKGAVTKVAGISKQDGVKNVFVRGLGDRYNTTTFNGFPVPSEDPEYKNISLDFFGTDLIQSVGVNKAFTAGNGGDVGGAILRLISTTVSFPTLN